MWLAYTRDRICTVLHLPPSTIMEHKSNNGAYTHSLSLLSSLRQIHRLHGRQILLLQFNYWPHATFMILIIPFFWEARLRVCYHVLLYPFLCTRCPHPLLDLTSCKKGSETLVLLRNDGGLVARRARQVTPVGSVCYGQGNHCLRLHSYSCSKNCPNVWLLCKDWCSINQRNYIIVWK